MSGQDMKVNVDQELFLTERVRHLTGSTYVLRFSRNGMEFTPGQHLVMGPPDGEEMREYSIYSGNNEEYLEVLIKEVDEGLVSRQLKNVREGDPIQIRGPYGFFLTKASAPGEKKLLFISSGTGIAPFHSFVRSAPGADYRIIHGVRNMSEAYDLSHYRRDRITVCTSRDDSGDFAGRITDYLLDAELGPDQQIYLGWTSHMILDAMDILR
ncbi:MAG: oxidoreductase, partial [Bacteroidetes bacterium]